MSDYIPNPMDRRRFLGLLGMTGVGLAAAACAGPGSSSSQSGTSAPSVSGPVKGDVSFAHWRSEDQKVFEKIIAGFSKANPDASVQQDISPSADYQSSALQRLRSGNVGDVFAAFRGAQFTDMASSGLFADLGGQDFASTYSKQFAGVGRSDGKQLGLPYQVVFLMPVFNVDLFDKVGISEAPKDWDGFLSMCDRLKGAGVIPLAWPGGEPGNAGQLFNSMVMNNAPSPDMCTKIESGEYKCTDDWFLQTLEQYAQLRPYMQKNASGTQPEPLEQLFASGKAGMLATGSYHIIAARALGAKFPMDVLSPITVAEDEARYSGVHNATFILGVNSASDSQAASVGFVEYLSRPEVASVYANGTAQHVPIDGVEYTNKDLKRLEPWLTADTILAPRYQFLDLDVETAVEGACISVVGGASPQEAAESAQQIVDQQIQ